MTLDYLFEAVSSITYAKSAWFRSVEAFSETPDKAHERRQNVVTVEIYIIMYYV